MAKYDVEVVKAGGAIEKKFLTDAATAVYPGDAVKRNGDYVVRIATGDPELATDELMGIVTEASTDTAAAAGTVKVLVLAPDTIMRCKATTAANVDTQAKVDALKMHSVCFDLTSTTITIDEDEADDPNVHGLYVLDGDPVKGTLDFIVNKQVGPAGGAI